MELSASHLQYLLTIYRLSRLCPDVSSTGLANALGVRKASVTKMMRLLTEQGLVVRERYGKIYLAAPAFLCARRLSEQAEALEHLLTEQLNWTAGASAAVCTVGQSWAAQWLKEAENARNADKIENLHIEKSLK